MLNKCDWRFHSVFIIHHSAFNLFAHSTGSNLQHAEFSGGLAADHLPALPAYAVRGPAGDIGGLQVLPQIPQT
jgi:hypothetical protein